jgi:DNA-binding LytR/AlgR family response regulator
MNILIIEDESITASDLAKSIQHIRNNYQVVYIADSIHNAIKYLQLSPKVDLIFSDIQLGDGLSFDIFNTIKSKIPVIFCTAFNHYAIDAFASNGFDYILKPYNIEKLQQAIEKYEHFTSLSSSHLASQTDHLPQIEQPKNPKALLIHVRDKIISLPIDNIALVGLTNGLVMMQTFDGKKIVVHKTLEEIEQLDPLSFCRANRQYLVHRKAIIEAQKFGNRKLKLSLNIIMGDDIIISKEKSTSFLRWYALK